MSYANDPALGTTALTLVQMTPGNGPEAQRGISTMLPGNIGILENTRFHLGEEKNDPELARGMAALGDYYVNDAFSTAHRAHASTEGVAHLLPS